MVNCLGHHIISYDNGAEAAIRTVPGSMLKLVGQDAINLSLIAWYKANVPGGLVVYRPYWQYQTLDDPIGYARQAVNEAPWADVLEGLNEAFQTRKHDELARYAAWSVMYGDELHRLGRRYACGSFSTGNPSLSIWIDYAPALTVADFLAVHEYGNPTMIGHQDCLRYRRLLGLLAPSLRRPVLVTECGLDDGQRHGWRTLAADAADYADQLVWYAQELASDGTRAAIFSLGCRTDFSDFEYGDSAAVLGALLANVGTPAPIPPVAGGGQTMGLAEQYPTEYAAWEQAGGGENAFRGHLMGIGAIPADVPALMANVESAWRQLANNLGGV